MSEVTFNRDDIVAVLKENVANVTFTKVDGSTRVLNCTLKADMLPAVDPEKAAKATEKTPNPNVVSAFDLENDGWRSFRVDSVKDVAVA